MANMKKILGSITVAVVALYALVSCDPWYNVDVYVKNSTSQTIVFQSISKGTKNSPRDYSIYDRKDSIVIKSGERVLLFHDSDIGTFGKDDKYIISGIMENRYPNGIMITYADGDTITHLPDSVSTDFNSPYDHTSYSFRFWRDENEATYVIMK